MKKLVAIGTALLIAGSVLSAAPAASAQPAPTSVSAAAKRVYVKQPKAVPGRFCKKVYKGKYTKTKKYGTLKCAPNHSRAKWKRV